MRTSVFAAAAAAVATLPSCFQLEVSAHAGYAQLAVDGDLGYVSGAAPAAISQDLESAFGLGDDQGRPYARVALDTGVQVIAVSAFTFEESGTGVLEASFGDSGTLVAGTSVRSDLELWNAKASYAFELELGPVSIAPGICANYLDLDLRVRDLIGLADERAELQAPVPMAFVRGTVGLGVVSGVVEIGYMAIDVDDVDTEFLDVEVLAMVHPTPLLDLFAGYRLLALDAEGEIDGDAFDADLQVGGFVVGGGVRF
jgi:hypothetical protein